MKRNFMIVVICLLTTIFSQGFFQESFANTKLQARKALKEAQKATEAAAKDKAYYEKQIVNKSYTFLNIGENDTLKSVASKMSDEFRLHKLTELGVSYPTDLHERLYHPINGPDRNDQSFKKTANNYYRSAQNIIAAEKIINKQGKTMVHYSYLPKQEDLIIQIVHFYFSKSNEKLLWYEVVFKPNLINDLSKKFIEKFGDAKLVLGSSGGRRSNNPLDTSMRTAGNGLYYWEKENDCAYLFSKHIIFDDPPRTNEYLVIVYGENINEYIGLKKQIHEQSIREEANKKSEQVKELDKF